MNKTFFWILLGTLVMISSGLSVVLFQMVWIFDGKAQYMRALLSVLAGLSVFLYIFGLASILFIRITSDVDAPDKLVDISKAGLVQALGAIGAILMFLNI
jgi:hypothetical protein